MVAFLRNTMLIDCYSYSRKVQTKTQEKNIHLPSLDEHDFPRVFVVLIDVEKPEFRLGDDLLVEGPEVCEELVHLGGVDVECDEEGDGLLLGHGGLSEAVLALGVC